jgi:hypothetical protein
MATAKLSHTRRLTRVVGMSAAGRAVVVALEQQATFERFIVDRRALGGFPR